MTAVKILVINLDSATERLAHMENEMSNLGLSFERMPAVSAQDASASETLLPAEIGCYLSHVACWKRFLETDDEHCLILEDDVVFAPSAHQVLRDLSWWTPGVDIVKIETMDKDGHPIKLGLERVQISTSHYYLRRLIGSHLGAAAYIMSRRGAELALEHLGAPTTQVDQALFAKPASLPLQFQQMVPAPVHQLSIREGPASDVFVSTITPGHILYRETRPIGKRLWYGFVYFRDQVRLRLGFTKHERAYVRFG